MPPISKNQKVEYVLKKFYYFKMCYGRAHAYAGIPKEIVSDFLLVSIYLQSVGITHKALLPLAFLSLFIMSIAFGHYDIKKRHAHMETEVNNQLNPQLMSIYENTKNAK